MELHQKETQNREKPLYYQPDLYREKARETARLVNQVILGKEKEIKEVMLAFLANGHILLEDIPGVGKTTLAIAFSRAMELDYKRVQFTPDVMPSDLTGFSIYSREKEKFVYQPGSVFCNLLLADEINRTSPKTQSALLEVMEERQSYCGGNHQTGAPALFGDCHAESCGKRRYPISSRGADGPIYGGHDPGLSGL